MNYGYNPNINSSYMNDLQVMRNRIDQQLAQMAQPQQIQQPQGITQNFQIAPQNNNMNDFDGKYAENIEDVKNTLALKNTLFINKTNSLLWFKDVTGNIKSFSLNEIIEKDEKDLQIEELKNINDRNSQIINELKDEIQGLKGVILNVKSNASNDDEPITNKKSARVSTSKSNDE